MTAGTEVPRLLLVSSRHEDHASLRRIFQHSPWEMHGVFTASDGINFVHEHSLIPVVICEHSLPDGNWKFVLNGSGRARVRPVLIVSTRLADERLWAEVLNLGAYDLLAKPFDAREVLRTVQVAHRLRNDPPGPVDARQKPLKSEAVGLP